MRTPSHHESCAVFRRKAVSSTQRLVFLLDPQDLQPQLFLHEIRHSCLPPRPCFTVPPSFELRCCDQERAHDVVSIFVEILLGLVRVLPCIPPKHILCFYLVYAFSLYILCECECFNPDIQVLYCRSPGLATKTYG